MAKNIMQHPREKLMSLIGNYSMAYSRVECLRHGVFSKIDNPENANHRLMLANRMLQNYIDSIDIPIIKEGG